MALSDELARLSVRAKQAEERAAAAKTEAREQLEETVEQARNSSQQAAAELGSKKAAATEQSKAWAAGIQKSWNEHVAQTRQRIDARKARHAADRAEADAEDAEDYADYSIDLAYSAIEEAEYAVLDALLARKDAASAAHTVGA